jgi:hypothetical protein
MAAVLSVLCVYEEVCVVSLEIEDWICFEKARVLFWLMTWDAQ